MPIALPREMEGKWLDLDLTDAAKIIELARDSATTDFVYHAVNPRVNISRSDDAQLIESVENSK